MQVHQGVPASSASPCLVKFNALTDSAGTLRQRSGTAFQVNGGLGAALISPPPTLMLMTSNTSMERTRYLLLACMYCLDRAVLSNTCRQLQHSNLTGVLKQCPSRAHTRLSSCFLWPLCTHTLHPHSTPPPPAPTPCTLPQHPVPAPTPCTYPLHPTSAPNPCTQPLHPTPALAPCTHPRHPTPASCPCTHPQHSLQAPTCGTHPLHLPLCTPTMHPPCTQPLPPPPAPNSCTHPCFHLGHPSTLYLIQATAMCGPIRLKGGGGGGGPNKGFKQHRQRTKAFALRSHGIVTDAGCIQAYACMPTCTLHMSGA